MASAIKHKKRSSRKNQFSSIPVNQFYAHAQKVADAQYFRKMFKMSIAGADAAAEATAE